LTRGYKVLSLLGSAKTASTSAIFSTATGGGEISSTGGLGRSLHTPTSASLLATSLSLSTPMSEERHQFI
jgi:hypothetical protein